MTRHRVPWAIHHLQWVQDRHTLYCYPSAMVPAGLKHSTHPMSIWLWRSAAQPECRGQTGLLWLPRNLWTNVTTSVLTTFSKCLLNKDVVPYTLSQGAKKVVIRCDQGWHNQLMWHIFTSSYSRQIHKGYFLEHVQIWWIFSQFPILLYFVLNVLPLSIRLTESVSFRVLSIKWESIYRGEYTVYFFIILSYHVLVFQTTCCLSFFPTFCSSPQIKIF